MEAENATLLSRLTAGLSLVCPGLDGFFGVVVKIIKRRKKLK
jgi:hypothetical protein